MMTEKAERLTRQLTPDGKERHAEVRQQVMKEFPPATNKKHEPPHDGIAAHLRQVRKSQRLTYEAVAQQAGVRNANTVSRTSNSAGTQTLPTSKPSQVP